MYELIIKLKSFYFSKRIKTNFSQVLPGRNFSIALNVLLLNTLIVEERKA